MNTKKTINFNLKNYKAWYKKITYKDEIISWLINCQHEIRNISNLSESIQQYITVVKKVNKQYKGNVMSIKDYIFTDKKNIYTILEISKKMDEIKGNILFSFFEKVSEKLKDSKYNECSALLHLENSLTKQKCINSFKKSKNVPKHYGLLFDCKFATNKYLFIKVAKTGLYYGVVCENKQKFKEQKLEKFYFCDTQLNKILKPKHEPCGKHFGDINNIEKLIEPNNIIDKMLKDIEEIKKIIP
jgi:hypothetical protein